MGTLRAAGFWLVAFVFAFAVWMVHDDSLKLPELAAGVGVAALAATGTELVRRQRVAGISIKPRFVRRALHLIPSAIRDCGTLTRVAFAQLVHPEPVRGRTIAVPFSRAGDDPPDSGRRALAQGLGSFAPNTIVVGIDPERNVLIAHQLAPSSDSAALDPLELG